MEDAICLRTFNRWVQKGSKLAAVAWGGEGACFRCVELPLYACFANFKSRYIGSMYLVLLIGAAGLKPQLLDGVGQFAWHVASALRDPNPGTSILFGETACSQPLLHDQKKPPLAALLYGE